MYMVGCVTRVWKWSSVSNLLLYPIKYDTNEDIRERNVSNPHRMAIKLP